MWPFRRRPELTEETYHRWLRAGRPPWLFFLEQPEDVQEQLARIGDEHNQDIAVAIGYAVRDPELAEKLVTGTEEEVGAATLASAVKQMAQRLAAREAAEDGPASSTEIPQGSMAGLGARRTQANLDVPSSDPLAVRRAK